MRRLKVVTVADLPDLLGAKGPRPVLRCPACGAEWSAHRGDYWHTDPGYEFLCGDEGCGGEPLRLVVKTVRYKAWKAGTGPA